MFYTMDYKKQLHSDFYIVVYENTHRIDTYVIDSLTPPYRDLYRLQKLPL